MDGTAAMRKSEGAALDFSYLDMHAASMALVADQPRIGIELVIRIQRAGEEFFVDRILALDGKDRQAPKPQLFVQGDCLLVVVKHRQIHMGGAPRRKML